MTADSLQSELRYAPLVSDLPTSTLIRWRIIEVGGRYRHLVGVCLETFAGRASTALVCFDSSSLSGLTASGRAYQLSGPPGMFIDVHHVWGQFAAARGFADWRDVTESVVPPPAVGCR